MQPFALPPQPFSAHAVANADSIREHSGSPYIPTEAMRKQLKHADAAEERKNQDRIEATQQ